MFKAQKLLGISLLVIALTACNNTTQSQDQSQSNNTEEPTTVVRADQTQVEQSQKNPLDDMELTSKTQNGVTVAIKKVTKMGDLVKIYVSINNNGTDEIMPQLGVAKVEQNGQTIEVVDYHNSEYLKFEVSSGNETSNLKPNESGEGYIVFKLPDPNAPFKFKIDPYEITTDNDKIQSDEPFIFDLTP